MKRLKFLSSASRNVLAQNAAKNTGVDMLTTDAVRKMSGAGHMIGGAVGGGLEGVGNLGLGIANKTARGVGLAVGMTGESQRKQFVGALRGGVGTVVGAGGTVVGGLVGGTGRVLRGSKGTMMNNLPFRRSKNNGVVPVDGGEDQRFMERSLKEEEEEEEEWDEYDGMEGDGDDRKMMELYGRTSARGEVLSPASVEGRGREISFRGRGGAVVDDEGNREEELKDLEKGVLQGLEGGVSPEGNQSQEFLKNVMKEGRDDDYDR